MIKNEGQNWHFERGVSLSHLLTTAAMFLMLIGGYARMSERLAILENQQGVFNQRIIDVLAGQYGTDSRQDAERAEIRRLIREDLQEINQKLDSIRTK